MNEHIKLAEKYASLLSKPPRRTNECWVGDLDSSHGVFVCGHKFLLHLEGTALSVWRLLDGRQTLVSIADRFAAEYDGASLETILEQIIACVLGLEALGLAAWRSRPLFEDVPIDDPSCVAATGTGSRRP